ncbi:MAG TPA: hypothetical protein PLS53_13325 [Thermoanaerobaculaceae bacterium]|nr:hypothetical protein [Thermoanaerobaculaceae bacterium]
MRLSVAILVALTGVMLSTAGCARDRAPAPPRPSEPPAMKVVPDIAARRSQLVEKQLKADLTSLPANEREVVGHLVAAARIIDDVFLLQAWAGNPAFAPKVATLQGPLARPAHEYYRIMGGPWDRLKDNEPFLGELRRPAGAGFYPEDMTKEQFDAWVSANPGVRADFTSPLTVIGRDAKGLVARPYSEAYRALLERAAAELRAAAGKTTNESLKKYLTLRAEAFASNDYFVSDMAWMDLDSPIEIVIGPYETYEDSLFGYKAAFEAFVCVTQPADSERLAVYKKELPFLESRLPIPPEHLNTKRGGESPIRVTDLVYSAGDARKGVQTLAFNLPNDERVREAKGSKKVLLKNTMLAKYEAILMPIASRVLPVSQTLQIDFDSYFNFILFHELSHGLGPGRITVSGKSTEVRLELKELYSAIEEAKADVLSVYSLAVLANKGVLPESIVRTLPWSYVAGFFRTVRFGANDAHGLGVAIQANYLQEKGALAIDSDGRYSPVLEKFAGALKSLAHDLLMIEAEGSYAKAREMVEHYGKVKPEMARLVETLKDVPVDIDPVFEADAQR